MSYHLHMYSTLKDEKILKIVRHLGFENLPMPFYMSTSVHSGHLIFIPSDFPVSRFGLYSPNHLS